MRKFSILFGLMSIMIGCVTTGPLYSPMPVKNDKALVYLMRTSIYTTGINETKFTVNGVFIVKLFDNGYSWIYLDPGTYVFSIVSVGLVAGGEPLTIRIPVESGKTYFLQNTQDYVYLNMQSMIREVFRSIEPELGQITLKNHHCKPPSYVVVSPK